MLQWGKWSKTCFSSRCKLSSYRQLFMHHNFHCQVQASWLCRFCDIGFVFMSHWSTMRFLQWQLFAEVDDHLQTVFSSLICQRLFEMHVGMPLEIYDDFSLPHGMYLFGSFRDKVCFLSFLGFLISYLRQVCLGPRDRV